MYIVMVTPECAPAAKVGGLGDVVQGLSKELVIRGNAVEIILPKYDCLRYDRIYNLSRVYDDLWVPFHDRHVHCTVYFGFADTLRCFFIEPHSDNHFFQRGIYYGHRDDPERFAFFSRAALEFMLKAGKHPDIIHCHDWQTGLVPVLLFDLYKLHGMTHPRICYTLHNVRHQGVTGDFILRQVGLNPSHYMCYERLQDNFNPRAVNLMKGGIVYSNFVTTVSRHYADEIKHTPLGYGLQLTLGIHGAKFGGVRNGVDYSVWNPEIDRYIAHRYAIDFLNDKYRNKEALRHRFWLRQDFKPLIAAVGRLDHQKGVELIKHAIFYSLSHNAQFVLLGSSLDPAISSDFWELKHYLNDDPNCHLEISYNEELAHLIYAGADMIVIPSTYEPCGLTQLIAMKYGTIPIIRNTGGLADTVFDADYAQRPYHERNGYAFNDYDRQGLESAMRRAIGLWYDYPQYFRELMLNGMNYDYSWKDPGQDYLNIYNYIKE